MNEQKRNSVLIVDDEKLNIIALTEILKDEYDVFAVRNSRDSVEVAKQNLPDVILLDVLMPEMDGYTVIADLKSTESVADIPVIFITGLDSNEAEEKGLALGAADYIPKPFHSAIVKLRVRNQIERLQRLREQVSMERVLMAKELTEKASRTKSEFLSRMSHEMRTPMNMIMGTLQIAKMRGIPENMKDACISINAASHDLLRLIDSVLDISDIEEDKTDLNCAQFNIGTMVEQLIDQEHSRACNGQIRKLIFSDIDPETPETVFGDKKRIAQIISNLLSNAVKFTDEQGLVQLRISVPETDDETVTLKVKVVDDGIGIGQEQQKMLFQPFEQVDGSISRKFGGIGSGLFIAKHFVELMDGRIWVDSEPGIGTKVTFTIKLKKQAPDSSACSNASYKGKTALLADDVDINRDIIIALLEDTKISIECAVNGKEALDMFSSEPEKYDIIIMDINMPEMDGVEATKGIRRLETPKGKKVPIIAMTANVLPSEVAGYIDAGMDGHIGKPVDLEALVQTLDKYLICA